MASTPNGVEPVDQSLRQPLMAIHRQVAYGDDLSGDSHHKSYKSKEKLPTIPDLRFEYSYLRGVRQYVHVERMYSVSVLTQQHRRMSTKELLDDQGKVGLPDVTSQGGSQRTSDQSTSPKEVIHVQWKKAIWATTRDQVISPFLQGAFWAILVYVCSPFASKLGHLIYTKPPPKEGNAVGWLRKWVKSLGLTSKWAEKSKR